MSYRIDGPMGLSNLTERLPASLRQLGIGTAPGAPTGAVPEKYEGALRLATLNLAHGRGPWQSYLRRSTLEDNLYRLAGTLRQVGPDVVALQEADGPSSWSGNFDHVATLADLTDFESHFRGDHQELGGSRFKLSYGTALMTSHRLHRERSHRFQACWRDTKGFVVAAIDVPQWNHTTVDVVSVHLDPLRPTLRRRQIRQMIDVLQERGHPLVVLGDLNCCFRSDPSSMRLLIEALRLHVFQPDSHSPTYPAQRPSRRLDWILASTGIEFGGYGTLRSRHSDHLIVAADLILD